MTGRLEGKVALVAGAAGAVGRAQATRFAQEGARIIALDIDADLDQTVESVSATGGQILAAAVDVRDLAAVEAFTAGAVAEFGGLDIVCATAAITSRATIDELDADTWQTMLDINLKGAWHSVRAATPHLIARGGGSAVLTSTAAALRGFGGISHQVAAEHGLVGLMRTLAIELAPHHIRVNAVHAGAEVEAIDIANAALFLASDESRHITAVGLPVDAGSTQR